MKTIKYANNDIYFYAALHSYIYKSINKEVVNSCGYELPTYLYVYMQGVYNDNDIKYMRLIKNLNVSREL